MFRLMLGIAMAFGGILLMGAFLLALFLRYDVWIIAGLMFAMVGAITASSLLVASWLSEQTL